MRVPRFLADHHVPFESLIHPPAYSAQKRARFLHVPGHLVVKAVVVRAAEDYLLAITPATHRLDLAKLAEHLRGSVRLATSSEIAEIFRDCEIGAVPPFGSLYGLASILDDSIDSNAMIVFEGHTHFEAIRMRCSDYERLEQPRRLPFAVRNGPSRGRRTG